MSTEDALWYWPELCEALGLPATAGPTVTGVAIDSRRLQPGELFIALAGDPGPRFTATSRSDRDGHEFLHNALAAGAVGAVVSSGHVLGNLADELPTLAVDDTLDGLWRLGAARRRQIEGPVIAVTGSSGKTTAKAFLAAALDAHATAGSLNNHIGVPLSLALTPRGAGPVVLELGMNHPHEIAPLAQLARPDIAVVVNVGTAHQENFDDPDGIRQEKLSISKGLGPEGVLVVHDQISLHGIPSLPRRIVRFGEAAGSDVQLLGLDGLVARYRIGGAEVHAQIPGGGLHRALTLGAVLAVMVELAVPVAAATELPQTLVPAGRGAVRRIGATTVIDDSYNANPASMAAALTQLLVNPSGPGGRYALLGEMKELGAASAAAHEAVLDQAQELDGFWLVGAAWPERTPGNLLGRWSSVAQAGQDELISDLIMNLQNPCNILIKGSNSVFWQSKFVPSLVERLEAGNG